MAATRKKTAKKKTAAPKSTGRKAAPKSKGRKKVKKVMHEYKQGKLKSGGSGKKVKSRKQAIAIALSEAREAGAKIPKKKKAAKKKSSSKKKSTKKKTAKKKTTKKSK